MEARLQEGDTHAAEIATPMYVTPRVDDMSTCGSVQSGGAGCTDIGLRS